MAQEEPPSDDTPAVDHRALFENSDDAIASVRLDDRRTIRDVNPRFAAVFDCDREAVTGESLLDVVDVGSDDPLEVREPAMETQPADGDDQQETADSGVRRETTDGNRRLRYRMVPADDDTAYVIYSARAGERDETNSERYRQRLYEITSDSTLSDEEKVQQLLELGCERLDVENGYLSRIDAANGRHRIVRAHGSDLIQQGMETDLSETFCRNAIDADDVLGIHDATEEGYEDDPAYRRWNIACYLGGKLVVDDDLYGTVCFVDRAARESSFTHEEKVFVDLLSRWVSHVLERRERREELEESERMFSTLVSNLPGMVYRCQYDPDWPMEFVSEGSRDLTGYDPEAFVDGEVSFGEDLIHPDDRERAWETVQAAVDKRDPFELTYRIHDADGDVRWVWERGRGVFDGDELEALEGFITDVTERKERERTIERERDRRAALFDTATDPIMENWFDGETPVIERVNDEFEAVFGVDVSDVVGQSAAETVVPSEDEAEHRRFASRVLNGESLEAEVRRETTSGTRDFLLRAVPVERPDGSSGAYAWYTDITERKERERKLERYRSYTDDVLDAIDDVFYVLDEDGYFERWNDSLPAATGYDETELDSMRALELFRESDHEMVTSAIEGVFETGHARVEVPFQRKDGQAVPYEFVAATVTDPEGNRRLAGIGRDISERRAYERELERTTDMLEQTQRVAEVGGWELDVSTDDWDLSYTTELYRLYGLDTDSDVDLETALEHVHPDDRETLEEAMQTAVETGTGYDLELRIDTNHRGQRWFRAIAEPIVADDEVVRLRGSVQDITARKEREQALSSLHDVARSLLGATNEQAVADLVVQTSADVLGTSAVGLYLLDTDESVLTPASFTPEFVEQCAGTPSIPVGDSDSPLWTAFATDEMRPLDGDEDRQCRLVDGPDDEGLVVPLGDYGVFVVLTSSGTVDAELRQLVETLVATTTAAFDRLDSEAELRERDEQLQAQNERLERQVQINETIRAIDQSLIDATDRRTIEQTVCDLLVDNATNALAWIGTIDASGSRLEPRAWAGTRQEYIDAIDRTTASREPSVRAIEDGSPAVVANVVESLQEEDWPTEALSRDVHSVVSVPLAYDEYLYGVLSVYANEPDAFGDLEGSVFAELGESIAHAINAIETQQALHAETVLELELRLDSTETLLGKLADAAGCRVEFEGLASDGDDGTRLFVRTTGADATAVEAALEEFVSVADSKLVSENDDGARFEVTVTEPGLTARLVRHGGKPRSIEADADRTSVVVDLPQTTNVREFIDMLGDRYPSVELQTRRDVERTAESADPSTLLDPLTDRQREVLRTAYFAGFFESPRETPAKGVAEMLDVSQPTVSHHLRSGQERLLAQIFDPDVDTREVE